MTTLIFFLVYITLHILVFLGIVFAFMRIIDPVFMGTFLVALGVLILIDIVFGLYYLISRSPRKGEEYHSSRYNNLKKVEESGKRSSTIEDTKEKGGWD